VGEKEPAEVSCTPTDPSLEYDIFEMVRLKLAGALERRGYGEIEAERIALYLVEVSRPVSHFLRVLTGVKPAEDDEIIGALGKVLDEYEALEKARLLLLRVGDVGRD
jgi:hypothetical protein